MPPTKTLLPNASNAPSLAVNGARPAQADRGPRGAERLNQIVFCLALWLLGRLIFLLILPRALPAQPNNKEDEAQQTPSNSFCGAQVHARRSEERRVGKEWRSG